jgi:hypothetical protein
MNMPSPDVKPTRKVSRDGRVGLGALGASGPDLAHASPFLAGVGALLIGAGLVMLNALEKSAS